MSYTSRSPIADQSSPVRARLLPQLTPTGAGPLHPLIQLSMGGIKAFHVEEASMPRSSSPGLVAIPGTPSDKFSWKKLWAFMGPGFLVSIAYMDPGNIGADISAGSQFKYSLIWVLCSATLLGFLLQTLSSRLGIVTGRNLAEICKMEYSGNLRILLWVLAEMTIIASDIPEVVGTSIALNILFGIPLWIGVVITSISVFLFLMINLFGVRKLELFIGLLIFIVLFCFLIEMFLSPISIRGFFSGFIPTIQPGSMFSITALIGAVVMPHNLYLHSALVQVALVPILLLKLVVS